MPPDFDLGRGYSLAETTGIDFGNYIAAVDIEQFERSAKAWVELLALAAIALVFYPSDDVDNDCRRIRDPNAWER